MVEPHLVAPKGTHLLVNPAAIGFQRLPSKTTSARPGGGAVLVGYLRALLQGLLHVP